MYLCASDDDDDDKGHSQDYVNSRFKLLLLLFLFFDPERGLKIRKMYKKLGMSSNRCSHDLANCHAKEPR